MLHYTVIIVCSNQRAPRFYIINKHKDSFIFQLVVSEKTQNLRRLEAQRNELNAKGIHFFQGVLY